MSALNQSNTSPLVEFRNVSYGVGDVLIVSDLNLTVRRGETLVLLGESGCGKTTTLRLVNRLLLPTSGEVLVEGKRTSDWDAISLRRRTGYVIQEAGLFPHFTVERNVALALAAEPQLLLMDEPFGALDPLTRAALQREFKELSQRLQKTVIFVTHDVREALMLATRIGLMHAGRLILLETPENFLCSDE